MQEHSDYDRSLIKQEAPGSFTLGERSDLLPSSVSPAPIGPEDRGGAGRLGPAPRAAQGSLRPCPEAPEDSGRTTGAQNRKILGREVFFSTLEAGVSEVAWADFLRIWTHVRMVLGQEIPTLTFKKLILLYLSLVLSVLQEDHFA